MTFKSSCYADTLTSPVADAEIYTYNVDSTGGSDIISPTITEGNNHGMCPRTCLLEVFNEDTEDWVPYNAGSAPYDVVDIYTSHPWVNSISSDGLCTLQIELLNANTFWTVAMATTRKDWQVRMTINVPLAKDATLVDNWTVSIGHTCSEDILALATPTASYPEFMIPVSGTGSQALAGHTIASTTVTKSVADGACDMKCALEKYNTDTSVWERHSGSFGGGITLDIDAYITSYVANTCAWTFAVTAANAASTPEDMEKPIKFRNVIWDPNSDQGINGVTEIYDNFEITMNYACSSGLVSNSGLMDSVTISEANDIGE